MYTNLSLHSVGARGWKCYEISCYLVFTFTRPIFSFSPFSCYECWSVEPLFKNNDRRAHEVVGIAWRLPFIRFLYRFPKKYSILSPWNIGGCLVMSWEKYLGPVRSLMSPHLCPRENQIPCVPFCPFHWTLIKCTQPSPNKVDPKPKASWKFNSQPQKRKEKKRKSYIIFWQLRKGEEKKRGVKEIE